MIPIPRKGDMTPEEHAACDEALALRRTMGLSQKAMAKQLGCCTTTLIRWEKHRWLPGYRYLARLQELYEMNSALDERERAEMVRSFRLESRAKHKLPWPKVRRMTPVIAVLAMRALGHPLKLTASEYLAETKVRVHVAYDPTKKTYEIWLQKPKKPSKRKECEVKDAGVQPN